MTYGIDKNGLWKYFGEPKTWHDFQIHSTDPIGFLPESVQLDLRKHRIVLEDYEQSAIEECKEWCKENCKSLYYLYDSFDHFVILFSSDDDCALFLLSR